MAGVSCIMSVFRNKLCRMPKVFQYTGKHCSPKMTTVMYVGMEDSTSYAAFSLMPVTLFKLIV
jgi:hypothetical protein